ncbi:MAG TPA: hypothetical protein VNK52_12535 [Hyphomicrobiaceae bacterium]|nr:hypothetical protein [Hyphomicrobiaceae bacterium]
MPTPDEILARYQETDAAMRSALAVPEVQAFAPCTFDQIGWPHSVRRAADLVRYADWCNHPGAADYFAENAYLPTQCASLLFTAAEANLLGRVSAATAELTRSLGREVRPLLSHLAQIGPFRIMMEIRRRLALDRITVFDVGAGSGYQSALLALAGNRVLVTDNAQGLYLFQSMLLKCCLGSGVRDWLVDGRPERHFDEPVHTIPWWEYLKLRRGPAPGVDIFFCNNNLGEMNYGAAAFTAHLANRLMAGSPAKLFLFTCLGSPKQSGIEMIDELLKRAGFVNLVWQPFWLYALKGHSLPAGLFDFAPDIPRWNAQPGERLLGVREVLDVSPRTLPLDLDFVAFTGVFDAASYVKLE